MEPALAWTAATIAAAAPTGVAVARASLELPGTAGGPSPRRYAFAIAACVIAAAWAVAVAGAPGAVGAMLGWVLVLLAMLDAEHFWLPHRLTLPLGLLGIVQAAALEPDQLAGRLIGAAAGFVVLALVAWAYRRTRGREGLGGGDARLLAAAGAWVGWIGLPNVLLIAALSGLLAVGAGKLAGRKMQWTDQVPFGVFLAVGLWLTWLYGPLGLPS